jgi:hypothetical protein
MTPEQWVRRLTVFLGGLCDVLAAFAVKGFNRKGR